MIEIDRIERLKKEMIAVWAWCWNNESSVRQQETARIRGKGTWKLLVDGLKAQLLLYMGGGQPTLEKLQEDHQDIQLVWLAVLDGVLWGYHLDLAGDREPPTVISCDSVEWMVFQRHRPLDPTVYQNQPYHIRNHLLHHHIIPTQESGDCIRVVMPGLFLRQGLKSLVDSQRPVKCYLGSFADGIHPDWNDMPYEKCLCSQLNDLEGRRNNLYQALEEARTLKADVVVLPELTLCPELRQDVCRWLQYEPHPFCMVVPGSFHEVPDPHSEISVNRTRLLDGKGREVLIHDKMIPMGTGNVCYEDVTPGKCLRFLKTPLGLVALAICRDFLESDQSTGLPWQKIAPDWAFIPSMPPSRVLNPMNIKPTLADCCGTRSLVPNQCPFGIYQPNPPGEENGHGFTGWPDAKGKFQLHTIFPSSRLVSVPI